ncbi:MAG: rRNA maturation RNase YbeY [Pseudomonadota bacterium]
MANRSTGLACDVAVDAELWGNEQALTALSERALSAAAAHVADLLPDDPEVSVVFTDDNSIQALNAQWRGMDKPTNVLSFAANDASGPPSPLLGDIVLAQETIAREAKAQEKAFDDHVTHLLVHGFLHLLGHDHLDDEEADTMEETERQVLAGLGIADPYGET